MSGRHSHVHTCQCSLLPKHVADMLQTCCIEVAGMLQTCCGEARTETRAKNTSHLLHLSGCLQVCVCVCARVCVCVRVCVRVRAGLAVYLLTRSCMMIPCKLTVLEVTPIRASIHVESR